MQRQMFSRTSDKSGCISERFLPVPSEGRTTLPAISLGQLIPAPQNLTNYYRYKGSLTTPGCTESVVWTVFENTIPLSRDQVRIQHHMFSKNITEFWFAKGHFVHEHATIMPFSVFLVTKVHFLVSY